MHQFDLYGKQMMVSVLEKAIEQASMFKDFRHEDAAFKEWVEQLKAYWSDLHDKLIALKNQQCPNVR